MWRQMHTRTKMQQSELSPVLEHNYPPIKSFVCVFFTTFAGASEKEGTPDGGSELFCLRQRPFPDLVSPV